MSGKVDVACPHCGEVVQRYASQVRWRGARFCSYGCREAAGRSRRMATCRECGKRYERASQHTGRTDAGKFCSRVCWRAWNERENRRQVELTCATCASAFQRPAAWARKNSGAVYCSRTCQAAGRVRPGSVKSRGVGWLRRAVEIRERDGRRCVRCGAGEEPARQHAVDHIVPWVLVRHRPELGNDPANLATLCHSCHGIKTNKIEPRILRGDWLALAEFYGERGSAAMAVVDVHT